MADSADMTNMMNAADTARGTSIVAVTACPTGIAHTMMAAEALKLTAHQLGDPIAVERDSSAGVQNPLTEAEIAAADVVIIAADIKVDTARFAGKPIFRTSTSEAIRNTRTVIEEATALASAIQGERVASVPNPPGGPAETPTAPANATASGNRLVAITSCPTGIAHTFMAARGLENAAAALGDQIKVETQGSVGAQNVLTPEDVANADAVIIAADTAVDTSRFGGKPVYMTSTNAAINDGKQVVTNALAEAAATPGTGHRGNLAQVAQELKVERARNRTGIYKHLMTGVSYMLPFIVAGGLLTALAFAVGGINAANHPGTLGYNLHTIGAAAFTIYVGALAAFIAYSIADRPGIAPGFIGGILATQINAGFLGGILAGFLAGYSVKWMNQHINLGQQLNSLKPVLILPFLGVIVVGLLMIYVVGGPVAFINHALVGWLTGMRTANALIVGLILGAMMAFDMGGPVNKSAYTFSVGLLASGITTPMAAVMAAGMTPPLGLALAAWLFKDRFDEEDREAAGAAAVLGISFITEGAIPYASKYPFQVIPSLMIGSAVAGAISMASHIGLLVPHGGIFVLAIPNAITNLPIYVLSILAGTLVTAGALYVLKRPIEAGSPVVRTGPMAPAGTSTPGTVNPREPLPA